MKNLLVDKIRGIVEKDKKFESVKEAEESIAYPTKLNAIDTVIGRIEDGNEKLGVDAGKILYLIGRSGSGKTTLAQQIATNIVDEFDQGSVVHFDVENSADRARVRKLSGWTVEEFNNKYIHFNTGINSETFYSLVRSIADTKLENAKDLEYETEYINSLTGETQKMLQPTVIILDSLSSLITKDVSEDTDISGGMTASHNAKVNAGIFRQLVNVLNEANIILIVINHITDNIDINPMQKTPAQLNYLKQNESIPGGKVPVFLANTLIKLDPAKKLKEDQDYGKHGFIVRAEILKSRSNAAGRRAELVFIPQEGFSNVLSNFEFLNTNKIIGGSGHGYYIETMPDKKFRRKNLEEMYETDKEFAEEFDRYTKEKMSELLIQEVKEVDTDESEEEFEIMLEEVEGEEGLFFHEGTGKYYEKENGEYFEVEVS